MIRYCLFVFIALFSVCTSVTNALAAAPDDARAFVDSVGNRVLGTLNSGAPQAQKQQQLRQLFSDNVDMGWMGRFVLGTAWTKASDDQRARYLASYREYMLMRYTTNFSEYTGSKYTITGVNAEDEGQYTVGMAIKSPNAGQQDTQAGYRVRSDGGQFKITDIIIEGVSLLATQRSEFASAVQSGGIEKLISQLDAKVKAKAS